MKKTEKKQIGRKFYGTTVVARCYTTNYYSRCEYTIAEKNGRLYAEQTVKFSTGRHPYVGRQLNNNEKHGCPFRAGNYVTIEQIENAIHDGYEII
jgi:hypothetical protein